MNEFNHRLEHKSVCYNKLLDWWKTHKAFEGEYIPFESMPTRVFTVSNNDRDLYSVAVYATDSDMCWIGWITSNPYSSPRERHKSLESLYNHILEEMGKLGFNIVISKTKQRGLMRTLDNTGFINIEPKTNFYIKNI